MMFRFQTKYFQLLFQYTYICDFQLLCNQSYIIPLFLIHFTNKQTLFNCDINLCNKGNISFTANTDFHFMENAKRPSILSEMNQAVIQMQLLEEEEKLVCFLVSKFLQIFATIWRHSASAGKVSSSPLLKQKDIQKDKEDVIEGGQFFI